MIAGRKIKRIQDKPSYYLEVWDKMAEKYHHNEFIFNDYWEDFVCKNVFELLAKTTDSFRDVDLSEYRNYRRNWQGHLTADFQFEEAAFKKNAAYFKSRSSDQLDMLRAFNKSFNEF